MQNKSDLLEKWKHLRSYGDAAEIARRYKICQRSVYRSLSTGKMSVKTLEILSDYYNKKSKLIS
jgi:hypothetical protein